LGETEMLSAKPLLVPPELGVRGQDKGKGGWVYSFAAPSVFSHGKFGFPK
jgi:hypothetical protein